MSAPQTSDTANITRVCVKNLPVELSVDQLRAIFAARGEVTDAKIMKTESGRSRKFGFVGFRTPDNAATAVSHFNKTFIQSNRIAVEFAVPQGDDNLNRAWSKYSHGSSHHKSRNPELYSKVAKTTTEMSSGEQKQTSIKEKEPKKMSILTTLKEKAESLENDPRFADFLGVMGAGKKTEFWANDTNSAVHLASLKEPDQSSKLKKGEAASKTISPAQPERISSQPPKSKKQVSEPTTTIETLEPAMSKAPKLSENEAVSDMDFLKSLMVSENDPSFLDSAPEPAAKVEPVDDPDSPKTWNEITAVEGEANFDAGRLFVRNLSFAVKEEELIELFAPFGSLSQVHIPIDSTKRGKGFAYLTYTLPENAIKACAGLDRKTFQGRLLHVLPAKEQKVVTSAEADIKKAGSSFKRQQAEKLARTSQNDSNWNTMFLRSATVADAIAQRLGVNKESVLDKHSDASLAVRMALAETQLLQETKEFLEDEGIRLQALAQTDVKDAKVKVCRSKTVILVKNIPFQTEPDEVHNCFDIFIALN
jgi:multiple RNA-binding domain-containing protein 1